MSDYKLAPGIYNIPLDSDLHKKVMTAFTSRHRAALASQSKMTQKWKDAEDVWTMYMPETDADRIRKEGKKNGNPNYVTIQIPYSYAMLMTSHTYYTSVFLGRDPVLQVSGRHGESQTAESAIESLLGYQLGAGGNIPPLFIWLLDPGKYGHGVLGWHWDEEVVETTEYKEVPKTFMGVPLPGQTKKELVMTTTPGYVGHRFFNVRVQDFLTDPRVPIGRFQEGEFCIHKEEVGWNKIAMGKANGRYFNCEAIKKDKLSFNGADEDTGSFNYETPSTTDFVGSEYMEDRPSKVLIHYFHYELIPSEWGFGSSNRPQKWVFTIANKRTVISAQPLGLLHNRYPFEILTQEFDLYASFTRGMLQMLDPLNQTMEWLINSHFFNVRSALNNQFFVDPNAVNMSDLENPQPGKLVRLKPAAYGRDIRTIAAQFPVQDITRSNLQDMDTVGLLAQRMMGATDNIMGMVNSGGRKTATEVRTSSSFGVNRLKTTCEWFSATGWSSMTQAIIQENQQLYKLDRQYRIMGDVAKWGEKYMRVTPEDIRGFYDFTPVDGTMPIDRFAQVTMWTNLLGMMKQDPRVAMQYDLGKIFGFVAQLGGIKNIDQFRIQVVPDGSMANAAQAGNVVPMKTGAGGPPQIPGMGAML